MVLSSHYMNFWDKTAYFPNLVSASSDIRSPLSGMAFCVLSYDSCMLLAAPSTLDTNKSSQFFLRHTSQAALQWFTALQPFTVSKHIFKSWGEKTQDVNKITSSSITHNLQESSLIFHFHLVAIISYKKCFRVHTKWEAPW